MVVSTKMLVLYARVYQAFEPEEAPCSSPGAAADASGRASKWTWPEAEDLLWAAFDKGGLEGWAKAAVVETEREAKVANEERAAERVLKMKSA